MPPEDGFLPFAVTTAGICLPTYLLILIVNNPEGVKRILNNLGLFFTKITAIPAPKRSGRLRERILERKQPHHQGLRDQPGIHKSATFASLEARLSQDLHNESPLGGSQGLAQATRRMSQSISNHLHGSGGRFRSQQPITAPMPMLPRPSTYRQGEEGARSQPQLADYRSRSSTIKFEEPFAQSTKFPANGSPLTTTVRDLEKSTSNLSNLSPTETPAGPVVVLTTPNESPGSSPPQRALLRPPDSRRERSLSPLGVGSARSLFGRLSGRLSSAMPSPKTSEPASPKEPV